MNFEAARREVLDACLELAERGYMPGTGGNVALRFDEQLFAMTPSSIDYYAMALDDICILRLDTLACEDGTRIPSIEHRLHAYVLRARPDCNASIHTHQPLASACSLLGRSLPIGEERYRATLGVEARLVPYAPSGTNWLAARLRAALRMDVDAYLLGNHGALCCGPTLEDTLATTEALESSCAAALRVLIGGRPPQPQLPWAHEALALLDPQGDWQ